MVFRHRRSGGTGRRRGAGPWTRRRTAPGPSGAGLLGRRFRAAGKDRCPRGRPDDRRPGPRREQHPARYAPAVAPQASRQPQRAAPGAASAPGRRRRGDPPGTVRPRLRRLHTSVAPGRLHSRGLRPERSANAIQHKDSWQARRLDKPSDNAASGCPLPQLVLRTPGLSRHRFRACLPGRLGPPADERHSCDDGGKAEPPSRDSARSGSSGRSPPARDPTVPGADRRSWPNIGHGNSRPTQSID